MCTCTFISCSFSFGGFPSPPPTYNCAWSQQKQGIFYDANLLMPCNGGTCDYRFENTILSNSLNSHSLYAVMQTVESGFLGTSFDLNWTVTIASTKTCAVSSDQSFPNVLNQDNYTNKFAFYMQDVYDGTPFVPDSNYIYPNEHKHDLVLQIHDVVNTYDSKCGTITWKYTWSQPSSPGTDWWFNFPTSGVKGTFVPNAYYQPTRHIYYDGQYEDF